LVLHDAGDYEVAEAVLERALTLDEQALGTDHPHVARDANNLAGVLRDLGDGYGARMALEYALSIYRRALGADHPTTRAVAGNLSRLG
jgi:tetratricopeptide (TPR) repeat protein